MYFEKSHFFPFFLAIRHFHVIFSGVRKKLLKDFKKMEFNEAELTNQDTIRKLMLLKREIGKYLTGDKLTKVTKLKPIAHIMRHMQYQITANSEIRNFGRRKIIQPFDCLNSQAHTKNEGSELA